MAILSLLKKCASSLSTTGMRRMSGHERTFEMRPSNWNYQKFKDMMHFYFLLGIIPLTAISTYVNLFVGPATLAPIPEGYHPREEEYSKGPITRWFVRNVYTGYQEKYERALHIYFHDDEKNQMMLVASKVKQVMARRGDMQMYSYKAPDVDKMYLVRESVEAEKHDQGLE